MHRQLYATVVKKSPWQATGQAKAIYADRPCLLTYQGMKLITLKTTNMQTAVHQFDSVSVSSSSQHRISV